MDFTIVYERKQRELENDTLLKIELESRGYTCEIVQYYEGDKFNIFNINPPKVILVPHLYGNANIYRTLSRFGKANHIVNLQYEQVLSQKWEKLGHHNPKDEAQNALHLCWGEKTEERLKTAGVPLSNLKVLGAPHLDLLRKEYHKNSKSLRNELGSLFNLDKNKRWTLFLSSFTYANISDSRLKMNEDSAGVKLESFREIHTNSRDKLLDWFTEILEKDTKNIFIYRPHPDELNLDSVIQLEEQYSNFRIIRYSAVKDWITASDVIYSWYSTSVVEAHFLDKPYSILRPLVLSESFDSVLLKHATFITEYNEFEKDYFKNDSERRTAIDDFHINQYYQIDKVRPAYKNYCDFLEEVYYSKKQNYTLYFKNKIIAKLKSISVVFVYFLYKHFKIDLKKYRKEDLKRNFFIEWFIEMDNQIVSSDEKKEIEDRLKDVLQEKTINNE